VKTSKTKTIVQISTHSLSLYAASCRITSLLSKREETRKTQTHTHTQKQKQNIFDSPNANAHELCDLADKSLDDDKGIVCLNGGLLWCIHKQEPYHIYNKHFNTEGSGFWWCDSVELRHPSCCLVLLLLVVVH